MSRDVKFSSLVGEYIRRMEVGDYEVLLYTSSGFYRLYHEQDCCEYVYVEDVCGDVNDIQGVIIEAEESSNDDENAEESGTWTFYKLGTKNGSVTIRFYGASNGYYSESVGCEYVDNSYGTIRRKIISYLASNSSKGGISMEHYQDSDHHLLKCYTEAVKESARKDHMHMDLARIQVLDKDILLPYLIKTVAEDGVKVYLLKETDNGDGTNTHIIEIVSNKEAQ